MDAYIPEKNIGVFSVWRTIISDHLYLNMSDRFIFELEWVSYFFFREII